MPSSKYNDMRFFSEHEIQKIADDIEKAVTIPVDIGMEGRHRVYDLSEMKAILEGAQRISVHDCGCKTEYENCDAPRNVCISLDETTDELFDNEQYSTAEIDVEEALKVLQKSHDAGLVHLAYVMKGDEKPGLVCSCCPCCCHTLGSLVRSGKHAQILSSRYIAANDSDRCVGCGKCVERCVVQTRQMKDGRLVYDQTKCFGCGLCVSTCPEGAIKLVTREA
ncbi:MAG: indolepyruvate ferredoxin oxidoreductase subunit alpha [Candidatus Thorarchaeota archaeon]|jgi:NAD-dependent dihydropyrimidine dehydrogenase PreA subunit